MVFAYPFGAAAELLEALCARFVLSWYFGFADDRRRWVTGNAAACELLGIAREEIPWRTMDEFTPPSEHGRLEVQWEEFLASGGAEGWYQPGPPSRPRATAGCASPSASAK